MSAPSSRRTWARHALAALAFVLSGAGLVMVFVRGLTVRVPNELPGSAYVTREVALWPAGLALMGVGLAVAILMLFLRAYRSTDID